MATAYLQIQVIIIIFILSYLYVTTLHYIMSIIFYLFRINMDAKFLPVSVGLPAGYLSVQPFGLGKGVSYLFSLI